MTANVAAATHADLRPGAASLHVLEPSSARSRLRSQTFGGAIRPIQATASASLFAAATGLLLPALYLLQLAAGSACRPVSRQQNGSPAAMGLLAWAF